MNNWTKSSFCGSNACVEVQFRAASECGNNTCVEVGFATASDCTNGSCVEVGHGGQVVLVRDSKNPEQAPLSFTHDEWKAFVAGVNNGEFDV